MIYETAMPIFYFVAQKDVGSIKKGEPIFNLYSNSCAAAQVLIKEWCKENNTSRNNFEMKMAYHAMTPVDGII